MMKLAFHPRMSPPAPARFGSARSTSKPIPVHELLDTQPDLKPVYLLKESGSRNTTKAKLLITAIWLAESMMENGWGTGFRLPSFSELRPQEWKIRKPLEFSDLYESARYLGALGIVKIDDDNLGSLQGNDVLRLPTQADIDALSEQLGRVTAAKIPASATSGIQEAVKLDGIVVKPQTLVNLVAQAQKAGSTIGALLDKLFGNPPQA